MVTLNRVFIHGLESSSQGNKARYFRQRYPGMIIGDFQGPLQDRLRTLDGLIADKEDLILVGSSFGGLMSAIYTCNHPLSVKRLILLAPALDLEDFSSFHDLKVDVPTTIFHGNKDDVVPLEPVRRITERIFTNMSFNILDDDHPLSATFETLDWDELLLSRS